MNRILVCGAGGFIGNHLVKRLKAEGHWVRGADLKRPEFSDSPADEFLSCDLRSRSDVAEAMQDVRVVYQLAADMGGAGYVFTGQHDAEIMYNSALINMNVADTAAQFCPDQVFFSSSACIYPAQNQTDPDNPQCSEYSAYPASPDSEYGWEKLWSERLYRAYSRNYGLDVRIARFHNIFGPEGTWQGGREKAPAAICRKVAEAQDGGTIEVWGDGRQTRSFLYIDECLEGIERLMASTTFAGPVNIGSEEMISIDGLVEMVADVAGKQINVQHVTGPQGVRGRNTDNRLIQEALGWAPSQPLQEGMEKTYEWIEEQIYAERKARR